MNTQIGPNGSGDNLERRRNQSIQQFQVYSIEMSSNVIAYDRVGTCIISLEVVNNVWFELKGN